MPVDSQKMGNMKGLGYELGLFLSKERPHELLSEIHENGRPHWDQWVVDNFDDILRFLEMTPANRTKKWPDIHIRRRLALAALVFHRIAVVFQHAVEEYGDYNSLNDRVAHKQAAYLGLLIQADFPKSLFPPDDTQHYLDMMTGFEKAVVEEFYDDDDS